MIFAQACALLTRYADGGTDALTQLKQEGWEFREDCGRLILEAIQAGGKKGNAVHRALIAEVAAVLHGATFQTPEAPAAFAERCLQSVHTIDTAKSLEFEEGSIEARAKAIVDNLVSKKDAIGLIGLDTIGRACILDTLWNDFPSYRDYLSKIGFRAGTSTGRAYIRSALCVVNTSGQHLRLSMVQVRSMIAIDRFLQKTDDFQKNWNMRKNQKDCVEQIAYLVVREWCGMDHARWKTVFPTQDGVDVCAAGCASWWVDVLIKNKDFVSAALRATKFDRDALVSFCRFCTQNITICHDYSVVGYDKFITFQNIVFSEGFAWHIKYMDDDIEDLWKNRLKVFYDAYPHEDQNAQKSALREYSENFIALHTDAVNANTAQIVSKAYRGDTTCKKTPNRCCCRDDVRCQQYGS